MAAIGGLASLFQAVVVLTTLSCVSATSVYTRCPEKCSCDVVVGVVDCRNKDLYGIPGPIDSWVKVMRLEGNLLVCDCDTMGLYESLPDNTLQGAVCSNLHNTPLADVATVYPDLCDTHALTWTSTTEEPTTESSTTEEPTTETSTTDESTTEESTTESSTTKESTTETSTTDESTSENSSTEEPTTWTSTTEESTTETSTTWTSTTWTSTTWTSTTETSTIETSTTATSTTATSTTETSTTETSTTDPTITHCYSIQLLLLLPWDDDYSNETNKHWELRTRITTELDAVFTELEPSDCSLSFRQFWENGGYVATSLNATCRLAQETSVVWCRDEVYLLIREAASTGGFTVGMDITQIKVNPLPNTDEYCAAESIPTNTDEGLVWFYSQLPNDTATAPCPENPDQNATRICTIDGSGQAQWDMWNTSQCETPSDRTKGLEDLTEKPVTNDTIATIAEDLVNLTESVSGFTPREVSLVVDVALNCLTAPNVPVEKETGAELLVSFDKMLSVDEQTLVEAERDNQASTKLVQSVELLGNKMEGTTDGVKIAEPKIGVLVTKPSVGTGLLFKTKGDVEDDLGVERMDIHPHGPDLPDLSMNTAAVYLPLSVVEEAESNTNVHFALYNSASFFKASEKVDSSKHDSISKQSSSQYVLNSRVVSAKIGILELEDLKDYITVSLKHLTNNSTKHLCVYWDFSLSAWSHEGCNVTFSSEDYTTCQCNHLTNFALIMDIYGVELPEIHNKILSILSYIGFSISAAGLLFTLVTYFTFRKQLLRDTPSKILVNLCAALLGIIVGFIFTSQWFVRENIVACKFMAALTHYFLLAAMTWMSVEAFYMYMALVRVLHAGYSKFILKCCLIGWGVPLIIVSITVGVSTDNYGKQDDMCWLGQTPLLVAVIVPVAICLLLNMTTFGLVIYRLRDMNTLEKSRRSSTQSRLLGATGLMVLLGLTWIFAFFAIGDAGVVFQYLFVVLNSLQGLWIFVFHCLRNGDARRAWKHCLRGATSGSKTSSTSGRDTGGFQRVSANSATGSTDTSLSSTRL